MMDLSAEVKREKIISVAVRTTATERVIALRNFEESNHHRDFPFRSWEEKLELSEGSYPRAFFAQLSILIAVLHPWALMKAIFLLIFS
jgi:hypothetical protein